MHIYLLIKNPESASPKVRGVFTTAFKAKNHDIELKGRWTSGPRMGWFEADRGGRAGAHHIIRPAWANEELELYVDPDAQDV